MKTFKIMQNKGLFSEQISSTPDTKTIFDPETLDYTVKDKEGGIHIVSSGKPLFGRAYFQTTSFDISKEEFVWLKKGSDRYNAVRAKAEDTAAGTLDWRRGCVWVYVRGGGYTVNFSHQSISEFLRKISEIQHDIMCSRKVVESWM